MRILFCGDVVGRSGRTVLCHHLPTLRERFAVDFVIVNGENAAGGFGITAKICQELYDKGVDVITTGNHVWDQRDIIGQIDQDPRLLRPGNFPKGTPGRGASLQKDTKGRQVLVLNVMGRLFMDPLDDPFAWVEAHLQQYRLGSAVQAIVIDFHAEATSEKQAMGRFVDGRASLSVGTHTHVPTADIMIMPGGTAYQTDTGMCGDYNGVIGMKAEAPVMRFTRKMPCRLEVADGEGTLCALLVDIDERTGKALRADPIRIGPHLAPTEPTDMVVGG